MGGRGVHDNNVIDSVFRAMVKRRPRVGGSSAPPDSISIQSVGGLAIRPGGLLTVTEDVISQVTVMVIMMMVHSLNGQI